MQRFGNFSSSSIWKLTTLGTDKKNFGKPALTYIKEKLTEIKLGRSLQKDSKNVRSLSWGNLCELYVFSILPLDYKLVSKERIAHKTISNWNGMPDSLREDVVGDTKSPFTLLSFVDQIESHEKGYEKFKKDEPEYFWQLISNSILADKKKIESIIFCPYLDELPAIRELANDIPECNWIKYATDEELPYLVRDGKFKNLNIFEYEVDSNDVEYLEEKVKKAVELLLS